MTISTIASTTTSRSRPRQSPVDNTPAVEPAVSRALVPLERPVRTSTHHSARPDASFVAHLIAMAEQTPHTRTLRRATLEDARVGYDRATARGTEFYGRVLSQVA